MDRQLKDAKERIEQLLNTVAADGAHYIFHAAYKDKDYRVLVKTPIGHTKICVPRHFLEQGTLTRQDKDHIFHQIFPQEVLTRIKNSDPDEINIPEVRNKTGLNWQRLLNWFAFSK